MPSDVLIDAFADAISEKLDADEFERLILGERAEGLFPFWDYIALIDLTHWDDESSALTELKASRALERLQGRYPELWGTGRDEFLGCQSLIRDARGP